MRKVKTYSNFRNLQPEVDRWFHFFWSIEPLPSSLRSSWHAKLPKMNSLSTVFTFLSQDIDYIFILFSHNTSIAIWNHNSNSLDHLYRIKLQFEAWKNGVETKIIVDSFSDFQFSFIPMIRLKFNT